MAEADPENQGQEQEEQNPEQAIAGTESDVQELLSKAGLVADTLNEAAAKLESAARTVDAADDALGGMQSVVLEVTGLEDLVPEVPAAPPAAAPPIDEAPAPTPVANAVAAAGAGGSAGSGSGTLDEENIVFECTFQQSLVPNKYAVDDYNFKTSTTDLISTATGKNSGSLRVYDYPAIVKDSSTAEARATMRMEEYESFQKELFGRSCCKAFIAGGKFELSEHDRQALNTKYVLHEVTMVATRQQYLNSFRALPADVPFRPRRKTHKPLIHGTQTAIVVGKDGEEIWTDEFGRVKVKFHWDQAEAKDETASCWIRVAHMWTGKSWGAIFIPRIGMEVVVSFLDGDPDRPLITGMVYNAQQTVPYGLPDNQTRSTIKTQSSKEGEDGFNELRFEDKKGSEEVYIHAQKDMNVRVENDLVEIVKKDKVELIHNNRQVFVKKEEPEKVAETAKPEIDSEGLEVLIVEGGNRKIHVKGDDKSEKHTNDGTYQHIVGKTFTLTVKGDSITIEATGANGSGDIIIKGKTVSIQSTTGDVKIKSAANVNIEAGQNMTSKAGMGLTNQAGTDLTNKAGTALTNKAGTSLTNEAGLTLTNKAGLTMENKASVSMTNDGGPMLTNKAAAMGTVDGGGMLTVKAGIVMVN
jgi:type VI secretion system secreted protein VgrG